MIAALIHYSKLIAFLFTVFVLLLCSFPGQYIPTVSWLEILSFDKWVHLSIFFILTFLWLLAYRKFTNFKFIIFISCVTYGGLLELGQSTLFSHRSTDYLDFIANSVGCLFAYCFFNPLYLWLHKHYLNDNCE